MEFTVSQRTTRLGGAALVLAGLLASALAWPSLPEQMAVHWDATGSADGTAPRAIGALSLPLLTAALLVLYEALPGLDPLGGNVAAFRGHYDGVFALLALFLTVVHGAVLAANLGIDVPIVPLVFVGVGVVLAYTGRLLGRAEPNWFVGVRTPWTLSNDAVWRRTNDLAGGLFVVGGAVVALAGLVGGLLGAQTAATLLVLGTVLVIAVVPLAYSYYCYERLDEPDDAPTDAH